MASDEMFDLVHRLRDVSESIQELNKSGETLTSAQQEALQDEWKKLCEAVNKQFGNLRTISGSAGYFQKREDESV